MKLYDSKEIGAILKKAAENTSTDGADTPMGLSLDELRHLAAEAGIDPEQITRAVSEIEMDAGTNEREFWGGPFSYNSQVLSEGEITAVQWEEMLVAIRDFFQSKGEVTARESVQEWSSPWGTTNSARVTALKDRGKTRISVGWSGPLTAVPFYIPVPLVAIGSVFFASEFLELTAVPGMAFTVLVTGLAFLAGRWALRRHLDKGLKKLRDLTARLGRIAGEQDPQPERASPLPDAGRTQAERNDPLLQMEGKTNAEPDIETIPRHRSRT